MRLFLTSFLLFGAAITHTQTWQSVGLDSEDIYRFAFDSSNANVVYVGSFGNFSTGKVGGIFRTSNAGGSWDTLFRGGIVYDLVLDPVDHKTIYAAIGRSGLTTFSGILKSSDDGKSWAEIDSGIYKDPDGHPAVIAIDPKNSQIIYAGTDGFFGGEMYKSTNQGMNWFVLNDSSLSGWGVTAIAVNPESTNVVYASPATQGIVRSGDGGIHWIKLGLENRIINDIEFGCTPSTVYVGTSFDVAPVGFFSSSDGGATWSTNKNGLPDTVKGTKIQVSCKPGNRQVFLSNAWTRGSVFRAGDDWIWKSMGLNLPAGATTICLAGDMLYAGASGVYVTQIVTSINSRSVVEPVARLSQNYPNPFNPSTVIHYALPRKSQIALTLYNALGQVVQVLVNQEEEAGDHEVRFYSNNLTSGMYFYTLKTKDFTTTKKLVLVH